MSVTRHAAYLAAATIALSATGLPALADDLKLPEFRQCKTTDHPALPAQWTSTVMLEQFKTPRLLSTFQLSVGEVTMDSVAGAMRATIYGMESEAIDLLVAKESTYVLQGPSDAPTGCTAVGPVWQPPGQDWLNDKAQCVGEQRLIETEVEWWKLPAKPDPATTWHWYSADKRQPFRSLFASPSDALAVLGQYAMIFYPDFKPVEQTRLPELLEFCRAQGGDIPAPMSVAELKAYLADNPNEGLEAERDAKTHSLIPGLSLAACGGQTLPGWPAKENLGFTTFMTPVKFSVDPFPTEILYQWASEGQRTRLVYPSASDQEYGDALLVGPHGYGINRMRDGSVSCAPGVMPGIPQPDWPVKGNCKCRGVLEDNPVLSPGKTTQILTCDMAPPSVFWTWYTDKQEPVEFYQTESPPDVGTGLALADYYDWKPGAEIPKGAFDVPQQCFASNAPKPPVLPNACYTCHLGSN